MIFNASYAFYRMIFNSMDFDSCFKEIQRSSCCFQCLSQCCLKLQYISMQGLHLLLLQAAGCSCCFCCWRLHFQATAAAGCCRLLPAEKAAAAGCRLRKYFCWLQAAAAASAACRLQLQAAAGCRLLLLVLWTIPMGGEVCAHNTSSYVAC